MPTLWRSKYQHQQSNRQRISESGFLRLETFVCTLHENTLSVSDVPESALYGVPNGVILQSIVIMQ